MGVKAILYLFPVASVALATPSWVKSNSEHLSGNIYTTTCSGEAPALDLARTEAKNGCLASATRQVRNHYKIKTVTVETETSVGLHQEVESNLQVSGLSCEPLNEEVESTDSQFKVWIQCKFDLAKAKTSEVAETKPAATSSSDTVQNRQELSAVSAHAIEEQSRQISSSENRILTISSIPQCTSILIEGARPRVESCKENPLSVNLFQGDTAITVRADKYRPKIIQLKDGSQISTSVQVILEAN